MQARLPSQVFADGMACFCNASNAHILQRIEPGTFERLLLLQLVRDKRCQVSDHISTFSDHKGCQFICFCGSEGSGYPFFYDSNKS